MPQTVKKIGKSVNICKTYERMYSGTVFIETWCINAAGIEKEQIRY